MQILLMSTQSTIRQMVHSNSMKMIQWIIRIAEHLDLATSLIWLTFWRTIKHSRRFMSTTPFPLKNIETTRLRTLAHDLWLTKGDSSNKITREKSKRSRNAENCSPDQIWLATGDTMQIKSTLVIYFSHPQKFEWMWPHDLLAQFQYTWKHSNMASNQGFPPFGNNHQNEYQFHDQRQFTPDQISSQSQFGYGSNQIQTNQLLAQLNQQQAAFQHVQQELLDMKRSQAIQGNRHQPQVMSYPCMIIHWFTSSSSYPISINQWYGFKRMTLLNPGVSVTPVVLSTNASDTRTDWRWTSTETPKPTSESIGSCHNYEHTLRHQSPGRSNLIQDSSNNIHLRYQTHEYGLRCILCNTIQL